MHDDLLYSPIAPLVLAMMRRGVATNPGASLLRRLEGGAFRTGSLRRHLREQYRVEVGAFSYGACLEPGAFEPGLRVGRYVSMARYVRWGLAHALEEPFLHPVFYQPRFGLVRDPREPTAELEIGADAWIGDMVVITAKCRRIGVGAAIGAGSVVTRDVPDFAVAMGAPARVTRMRFPDPVCAALLASRWWDRPLHELGDFAALAPERADSAHVLRRLRDLAPVPGGPG